MSKGQQLHDAVAESNSNEVFELLKSGVSADTEDQYGTTPLIVACLHDDFDIVRLLIGWDANANICNGEALFMACGYSKNVKLLKYLVKHGASLSYCNGSGYTLLHQAAEKGNLFGLRFALDYMDMDIIESIDVRANEGESPLMLATQEGHKDLVEELLMRGANVDAKDFKGQSMIHKAVLQNHFECLKIILSNKCKLNDADFSGFTALDHALVNLDKGADNDMILPNIVTVLLEKGALANGTTHIKEFRFSGNMTLIHKAVEFNCTSLIKLASKQGVDIYAKDWLGRTAVLIAIQKDNQEVLEVLYALGADFNLGLMDADPNQRNFLHMATIMDKFNCIKFAISKGYKVGTNDKSGKTALDFARLNNSKEIFEFLYEAYRIEIRKCSFCNHNPAYIEFKPCLHSIACGICSAQWKFCSCCQPIESRKNMLTSFDGVPWVPSNFTESANDNSCQICLENAKSIAFDCGHTTCEECSKQIRECPVCRKFIQKRLKLFL